MTFEGWIAVASALIAALASAYVVISQARAKIKSDNRQQQTTEHERLIDRQEQQLVRQQKQMEDQQDAIEKLYQAHAECREEHAETYGWVRIFHDGLIHMASEITRLGGKPNPVPDLPPRRINTLDAASSDFIRRTTAQNSELIKVVDPTLQSDSKRTLQQKQGTSP